MIPRFDTSLEPRSFPKILPVMQRRNMKALERNGVAHLVDTNLASDALVRFYFKSKEHVYEVLYNIIRRNRKYETPFFVFYGPFVKRGHAIMRI